MPILSEVFEKLLFVTKELKKKNEKIWFLLINLVFFENIGKSNKYIKWLVK